MCCCIWQLTSDITRVAPLDSCKLISPSGLIKVRCDNELEVRRGDEDKWKETALMNVTRGKMR